MNLGTEHTPSRAAGHKDDKVAVIVGEKEPEQGRTDAFRRVTRHGSPAIWRALSR